LWWLLDSTPAWEHSNRSTGRWGAASATVGIDLPYVSATVQEQPTFLPIDDVSKLYFYSSDADAVIDILYVG
jgi:hypothetical protein